MTDFHVLIGNFTDILEEAPRADINIFGLAPELSFDFMRNIPRKINTSCLFVGDSGAGGRTGVILPLSDSLVYAGGH